MSGSCAAVWSVTRSNASPRATSSGRTSAAFATQRRRRAAVRAAAAARTRASASSSDVGLLVEVPRLEPPVDRALVDLDAEDRGARHRRGERLGAAHPAEAGRQDGPPGEVGRAEVLLARGAERLVRPLEDPLGADVDPRAGGHLPEHRQPLGLEPAELVPRRPRRNEQRVRDQDARRVGMRPEHADGLARLDEERLVVAEAQERRARCRAAPGATARRARSRRRRRATPGARRPRDRGC